MSDSEGYAAVADAETRPATAARPHRSLARTLRWPLLIGIPLVAVVGGLYLYLSGGRYVATDDAYLQAAKVPISANIAGRVIEVDVRENQSVKAGAVLFRLDPRDFDTAAAQAEAQIAAGRQSRQGQQAAYGQRSAELAAAHTTLAYQQKELERQRALYTAGVASQIQVDAQAHAVDVARAQVAVAEKAQAQALASLGGSATGGVDEDPAIREARAAYRRAQLSQSYTVIRAPQDGQVTKVEQLQLGSYINAAQPVFTLVSPRIWVEANFKESQLTYMRPGQAATFKVDAYPGVEFRGRVESLSPGTGSSFSVLPAENATGNWVKVVQRLPVRLSIISDHAELPLHAGLSVKATVDTQHQRVLFGENAAAERRAQPQPPAPAPKP